MMGVNINDKHQCFTEQILNGSKTIETRNTRSLDPYIGTTVGIVRTGKGKAILVGTCTIGEPMFYGSKSDFDLDYNRHLVGKESPYYISTKGKWGYPVTNVNPIDPVEINSRGIIARNIDHVFS
jgi:predicted transcriptional regulator